MKKLPIKRKTLLFVLVGVVAAGIWVFNYWLMNNLEDNQVLHAPRVRTVDAGTKQHQDSAPEGDVIRKSRFEPNRQFMENIFFVNDKEIARFKSVGEKIYDIEGRIPDGTVKFSDLSHNSYGEEHYIGGQRHGWLREYYENGQMKKEAYYEYGRKMRNNEYFIDGTLRMEENFEDAMRYVEIPETGSGKTYYRDGTLMYEWDLTNMTKNRVTKAYNIKGELVEVRHFDQNGKVVSVERP